MGKTTKHKKTSAVINKEALQTQLSLNALYELKPNNEIMNYLIELTECGVNLEVINKALMSLLHEHFSNNQLPQI